MPMLKGKSRKTISKNIREAMHSYKRTGKFGTSRPKSARKAQKQIIAAALSTARRRKK
jgi:hypothetical protein